MAGKGHFQIDPNAIPQPHLKQILNNQSKLIIQVEECTEALAGDVARRYQEIYEHAEEV